MPSLFKAAERRKLGTYYTPKSVSEVLCEWAIRSPEDQILEPSFGGCGFLESSRRRLSFLGCSDPKSQIFGCDIDPTAFKHLYDKLGLTQLKGHFLFADFLSVEPWDFATEAFDAIVGNPPYVRHHAINHGQRQLVRRIRDQNLPTLSLQASLWAYFVLHSCCFLKIGGRVAWLLPSSFCYAGYAVPIKKFLVQEFNVVSAIILAERIFKSEGSDEATVVLIAEGWQSRGLGRPKQLRNIFAHSALALKIELQDKQSGFSATAVKKPRTYERLALRSTPLRDLCKFTIGVVTGASKFFLFNSDSAQAHSIPDSQLKLIVSRANQIPGLAVTRYSLTSLYKKGARTKILDPKLPLESRVASYLQTMPQVAIKNNLTFGKRLHWFKPLNADVSDAFFSGMSHHGPRLVLNSANVPCTNSLYCVTFAQPCSLKQRRLIAISLMSTFGQLSAEICGRRYGAGMLKHEPNDAGNIRVLLPIRLKSSIVTTVFRKLDLLMKRGLYGAATDASDRFLVEVGLITRNDLKRLRKSLAELRQFRRPTKQHIS
jgi:adenine-specific DNA-methyltransferase